MRLALIQRANEMRRYVRLTPFDESTPTGRSAERYRRVTLSALADAAGKCSGMLLMFLSVGLTIPYLGAERFGVWATITSLTAMLSFLDFGMGNALVNRIATAAANPDRSVLIRTASGGIASLAGVGLVIGSVLFVLAAHAPWAEIARIRDAALVEEARSGAIVFGVLFGFNIVATGLRSVFIGLQRAYEAHLVAVFGYIAAMVALLFAARTHADIPLLLLSTFGIQVFAALLLLVLAARRGILAWPGMSTIGVEARALMHVGGLFLVLQVGAMVGWGGDSLMVAHVLGPLYVAEFNVDQRLFQLVALPIALMSAPLWSAYADAKARDDHQFLIRTLHASLRLVGIIGSAGVAVVGLSARPLIDIWTHGAVSVSVGLVEAFAVWTLVSGLGAALGVFLNGTGVIRPQVVAVLLFVVIGLPLKWYFLENSGLAAFVACSVAVYLMTHVTTYAIVFRRSLARSRPSDKKAFEAAQPFQTFQGPTRWRSR